MVKNENSVLIIFDDKHDISCTYIDQPWETVISNVVNMQKTSSPMPAFSETHVLCTICWVNSIHNFGCAGNSQSAGFGGRFEMPHIMRAPDSQMPVYILKIIA